MTHEPRTFIDDFAGFIQASPSSYHAAAELARRLEGAGFSKQEETEAFRGDPGAYYAVRDGAVIAWRIPDRDAPGFRIVGAHTDSPSFKLKPNPEVTKAGWAQCGMEVYGGPLLNSWLNREMGLAGRLATKDGRTVLVETEPIMVIPQLAPHLDRSVNENQHHEM